MVGLAYFPVSKLGIGLPSKSGFLAVFWPAYGLAAGILIALGPRARWPVAGGVTVANFLSHLSDDKPFWVASALGLAEGIQTLVTAGLIVRYFGKDFGLGRLRHALGLLAAASVGAVVAGVWWIVVSMLFQAPTEPVLSTFQHWFMSDMVGFITVAPFVIGLLAGLRRPMPRREFVEGTVALLALAMITGIIISLPSQLWATARPIAWLFPMLLWLTARCGPVFAAAAVSIVSITIVSTAVWGIGHFGDPELPINDRILEAQTAILFVAFCALVLAALFSERRESAARLALTNMTLERERDNRLMNIEAVTASIAHELKQPLAAIAINGQAALRYLQRSPPDHDEARTSLNSMINDVHRTSEVLDGIQSLFRNIDQKSQQVDMNEIVLETLQSLQGHLLNHNVESCTELTSGLPTVDGNKGQLREVISNLIHNAIDAMNATPDRSRVLLLKTELRGEEAIKVTVEDTGQGIDADRLKGIFGALVTTKPSGMGLGLAICRMIVEKHGGEITASSDGKNGSLLQVVLPIGSNDNAATHT
jgi:signal transduction histidine kinase